MILACHGLSKSFGENVIVTEGSFHIEDHEKAALVGPNGAGKTTLFKMIVGELSSDAGEDMALLFIPAAPVWFFVCSSSWRHLVI